MYCGKEKKGNTELSTTFLEGLKYFVRFIPFGAPLPYRLQLHPLNFLAKKILFHRFASSKPF
jgi:hypothetical protein